MSVLSIKTFPDDLHRAARVAAAQRDEPLQELVIRAVRNEIERLAVLDRARKPATGAQ